MKGSPAVKRLHVWQTLNRDKVGPADMTLTQLAKEFATVLTKLTGSDIEDLAVAFDKARYSRFGSLLAAGLKKHARTKPEPEKVDTFTSLDVHHWYAEQPMAVHQRVESRTRELVAAYPNRNRESLRMQAMREALLQHRRRGRFGIPNA